MFRLLFVCTANQCRSPMAAALAQDAFDKRDLDVEVRSAGVSAGGFPSTAEAQRVMQERGLNLSKHRSTSLSDALEPLPDLILVMEKGHLAKIGRIDPSLAGKTFTLKGLVRRAKEEGPRKEGESTTDYLSRAGNTPFTSSRDDSIPDPIGQGLAEYQRCADELENLIAAMSDLLWPNPSDASASVQP